ncbi:MAG: hypothetical protein HZC28_15970 [Spirochaetes bacterium]|nr:hypothetical protein [Spirochaetota bacterium]
MALITLQFPVTDLRGRIGNLVICRWKGVLYARRYVSYNRSNTPAQAHRRTSFRNAVLAWQNLASDDKQRWSQAAAHVNMSGYNLFISRYISGIDAAEGRDAPTHERDGFASGSYLLRFPSACAPLVCRQYPPLIPSIVLSTSSA